MPPLDLATIEQTARSRISDNARSEGVTGPSLVASVAMSAALHLLGGPRRASLS
jgi:hypothetical protein